VIQNERNIQNKILVANQTGDWIDISKGWINFDFEIPKYFNITDDLPKVSKFRLEARSNHGYKGIQLFKIISRDSVIETCEEVIGYDIYYSQNESPVIVDDYIPEVDDQSDPSLMIWILSICLFFVSCGCLRDRRPPIEGEPAVARAKDGFGPYYPVVALTDYGDQIPGKLCTGFWGQILVCGKALAPINGGRIVTSKFKRIEGIITSTQPPAYEAFGRDRYHCGIAKHPDGNYHCGKIKNGVCYYEHGEKELQTKECWYIKVIKIDGVEVNQNSYDKLYSDLDTESNISERF
jgi:hypothetical protein